MLIANLTANAPSANPQTKLTKRKSWGVTKRRPQAVSPARNTDQSIALESKPTKKIATFIGVGEEIVLLPRLSHNAIGNGFASESPTPKAKSPRTLDGKISIDGLRIA